MSRKSISNGYVRMEEYIKEIYFKIISPKTYLKIRMIGNGHGLQI